MEVKAPGVIKLLGEHAVVYGKLAIAAGIDMNAKASSSQNDSNTLNIVLSDFNKDVVLGAGTLKVLYDRYLNKQGIDEYVDWATLDKDILPYATIAARLANEFGMDVLGNEISITSTIPPQSGLASSAACSTAFVVALANAVGKSLPDEKMIDVARDGDRVVHKNPNAGAIDVSTAYYGGVVSFSKTAGARKENITDSLGLILIDTGPKKSTAETVGHIAELYKQQKKYVEERTAKINNCSVNGLKALKAGNMKKLGALMYEDHELLKELGVSSNGLDRAVAIGKSIGAYGVKLSGGGGGGIAVAIAKDEGQLIKAMVEAGFKAYKTGLSTKGAKDYLAGNHT